MRRQVFGGTGLCGKLMAFAGGIMHNAVMDETRITNLESNITFQQDTIQDLSATIYRQQQEIDLLKTQLKRVVDKISHEDEQSRTNGKPSETERPPHY